MRGPSGVTATVNSKWAARLSSSEKTDQPSSPIRTSGPPALTIGSIASTVPSSSSGPRPGSPKFGTCGSSCISRPIPWPTRVRITDSPFDSTERWIALETSPRWLPGDHLLDPVEERVAVTSSRFLASVEIGPIGTVTAASATQPS